MGPSAGFFTTSVKDGDQYVKFEDRGDEFKNIVEKF